jgi:hypothetical protein
MNLDFEPAPTIEQFMLDDKSLARWLMGPVGSGKTHGCIMEILRRSAQQAPSPVDGLRYTRWAIVRNTLQQIKTTVLKDIQQVLTPIVKFKVSESTIFVNIGDIRSEWLLIPLDTVEDQRRLLSTQLTGAWVNEWREVNPELVTALLGRLGRFPSKIIGGPTWFGLIGDSNPGTEDSPWFEKLELELPKNWGFYRQPSGLSEEAENVENLPPGYYENLMDGAEEDWIKGHVYGEWMPSLAGTAVFRASFDPKDHLTTKELRPHPGSPLCVGLDLGRTPTALLTQMDWKGRLLVMEEVIGKDTGLEQFLLQQLAPVLLQDKYSRCPVYICFDPAGMAKSQLSEFNALDIVKRAGFVGIPAPTNDIAHRLGAVTSYLLRRNGLIMDQTRCPMLTQAMKFQYRYKRKKSGELEDKPEKLHPWSDLADALQYAALGIGERIQGRMVRRLERGQFKKVNQPKINAASWT